MSTNKYPSYMLAVGGWRRAGALLYRLTGEHRPTNFDEIRVTMANGSRDIGQMSAQAERLLVMLTAPQPAAPTQAGEYQPSSADMVMAALDTEEWGLERMQHWHCLTDEGNREGAWLVKRQKAPYCAVYTDKPGAPYGPRSWSGPTALDALQKAADDLGIRLPQPAARGAALAALKHPAVKPDMLVNGGALKLALNVLRRAGKNEVADELEATAQAAPVDAASRPLTDSQIADIYFEALGQHLREQDRKTVTRFARAIEAATAPQPAAQALDDGCPHGSKHVVHDCMRCGAPVCCGKCCAEDAQAQDALKQVCAIAVSALKTNSRDIADWREDMDRIAAIAAPEGGAA